MRYEHCCECDALTGRAGASDDSLYLGTIGPFCEECVNEWPDRVAKDLAVANAAAIASRNRISELEALIVMLYGRLINDEDLTADEASDLSGVIESIRSKS